MRLRIRGPEGQSTVTLDSSATVGTLREIIQKQTSLSSFEVKYGYPPKLLLLEEYATETRLEDMPISLNGEQLIVSSSAAVANAVTLREPVTQAQTGEIFQTEAERGPSQPRWLASQTSAQDSGRDSKPLSLSRKSKSDLEDPPEILLPELGGTLVLRIMPDDNSCLFRAIAAAVMSGLDTMTELRSMVAQTIQANPDKYSRAVLDNQNPDDYCRWIQTEDAWGGQIELDILSQQFDVEICSIDVQTLRVDKYNELAPNRCIVVYSGIHYDTIALSLTGMPPDADIKIYEDAIKDEVLPQAVELCRKLQTKHYYTDTAGFKLECKECGTICTGEKGAQRHAEETGHYDFGESS